MSDPMPRWIQPMLAKLSGALPADDERGAYEMKWDGIRGLAFVEGGRLDSANSAGASPFVGIE